MNGAAHRPRLLLVGGGGGLVGRAVLAEFGSGWTIRSVHRHVTAHEQERGIEWIAADAGQVSDWRSVLREVDVVLNLAWYRAGRARRFRDLADGLERLIGAAREAEVRRFLQVSVPPATASIETSLPYMTEKRRVDAALQRSGLSYSILRPTMLFGPGDKLLTVMLRTMARYHRFPMFGDGEYHLSPIAVTDLARILRTEADQDESRIVLAGGPMRWPYRALTDEMFARLGLPARYVRLSPRGAVRLARVLETLGSSLLYAYEVEWLVSDLLGLPPYEGLDRPLEPVEPFLTLESRRLRGPRAGLSGYF